MSMDCDVLIVGAGISGIAAAVHLFKNHFENFKIAEAENRFGGRIHTTDFYGACVELGAQWCHGEKGNKIFEFMQDKNILKASEVNFQKAKFFSGNSAIVDPLLGSHLFNKCTLLANDVESLQHYDKSLADYFDENFATFMKGGDEAEERSDFLTEMLFLDYFKKFRMSVDGANDWHDISAKNSVQYVECEGCSLLEWGKFGYSSLFDFLLECDNEDSKVYDEINRKIFVGKAVEKINYANELIEVTYRDMSVSRHKQVLCTVSLGVLKHTHQTLFEPKLPPRKITAIENLGFGSVNKIFLKFEQNWWQNICDNFGLLWTKHIVDHFKQKYFAYFEDDKFWFEDLFHLYEIDKNSSVLIGWIAGPDTDRICRLADDILIEILQEVLKMFVGCDVPKPIAVLRSNWGSNENFYGSYSYRSIDTDVMNTSSTILAEPVLGDGDGGECSIPRLLFAGEATHACFYSTVHGAFETGIREADRLLDLYKTNL